MKHALWSADNGLVIDGFTNAAEDFPAPPVTPEELRGKLDAFKASDRGARPRPKSRHCDA